MKRAAVLIPLPLLASMALAAEPAPSLPDFVRVQLQDLKLAVVVTRIPDPADASKPKDGELFSGELRNLAGTAKITSHTISQAGDCMFVAYARRIDGDQTTTDSISVSTQAHFGHLVTKAAEDPRRPRESVQLAIPASVNPPGRVAYFCQLDVRRLNEPDIRLREPTFAELWIKHPDEVNKYVKPMFESLDLQGIFSVKAEEAAHVFDPWLKGFPDIRAQIAALLPKLDDDSWAVRAAASNELDAMGINAVFVISALDLNALPVETRNRLQVFLKRMKKSSATPDNRIDSADFLMQCLAVDDPRIPTLARTRLEKLLGKKLDFDVKASLADRQATVEKLRLAAMASKLPH